MSSSLSLFHDLQPIHAVSLTKKAVRRAQQLSSLLYECGDDIEFWCERLGYEMFERELPQGIQAVLKNGYIVIREGLSHAEQVLSIAHEIYHHEFHGSQVAYREANNQSEGLEESQAESFAVLVSEPNFWKYDTVQEFYYSSPLPNEYKKLRENLFYKIKT